MVAVSNPQAPILSRTLATLSIGGDLLIPIDDSLTLVSSKSHPGSWHSVRHLESCTCESFAVRHTCRHLHEAREAAQLLDVVPDEACEGCGTVQTVRMGGHQFCGQCAPLAGSAEHRALVGEWCSSCGQAPAVTGGWCGQCLPKGFVR